MDQLSERYLEDFVVGQTFGSGRLRIDAERALAFAAEFDPQPFHLDESAARRSIFGGLTASGWHTAAVTMRLLVETELKPAGGLIGAGLDGCRRPRPVRPGDELRVECEVIEVRPSKSRPAPCSPPASFTRCAAMVSNAASSLCASAAARASHSRSKPLAKVGAES